MTTGSVILQDVDLALQALGSSLPAILGAVALFNPQVAAFMQFLPEIEAAIKATDTVAQALGTSDTNVAGAAVVQHLTPGQPNSPALSGSTN